MNAYVPELRKEIEIEKFDYSSCPRCKNNKFGHANIAGRLWKYCANCFFFYECLEN